MPSISVARMQVIPPRSQGVRFHVGWAGSSLVKVHLGPWSGGRAPAGTVGVVDLSVSFPSFSRKIPAVVMMGFACSSLLTPRALWKKVRRVG